MTQNWKNLNHHAWQNLISHRVIADRLTVVYIITGLGSSPFSSESSSMRNSPDPSSDTYVGDVKSGQGMDMGLRFAGVDDRKQGEQAPQGPYFQNNVQVGIFTCIVQEIYKLNLWQDTLLLVKTKILLLQTRQRMPLIIFQKYSREQNQNLKSEVHVLFKFYQYFTLQQIRVFVFGNLYTESDPWNWGLYLCEEGLYQNMLIDCKVLVTINLMVTLHTLWCVNWDLKLFLTLCHDLYRWFNNVLFFV